MAPRVTSITTPLACITLCMGVTSAQANIESETSRSTIVGQIGNPTPYEILWWGILDDVTAILCHYFGGCIAEPWFSQSSTVESRMQAQFDEYEANGIGTLTAQEETDLYHASVDAEKHLLDNPGAVSAGLEADYLNMLAEIIEQLQP